MVFSRANGNRRRDIKGSIDSTPRLSWTQRQLLVPFITLSVMTSPLLNPHGVASFVLSSQDKRQHLSSQQQGFTCESAVRMLMIIRPDFLGSSSGKGSLLRG
jgi:hypothetical protein